MLPLEIPQNASLPVSFWDIVILNSATEKDAICISSNLGKIVYWKTTYLSYKLMIDIDF